MAICDSSTLLRWRRPLGLLALFGTLAVPRLSPAQSSHVPLPPTTFTYTQTYCLQLPGVDFVSGSPFWITEKCPVGQTTFVPAKESAAVKAPEPQSPQGSTCEIELMLVDPQGTLPGYTKLLLAPPATTPPPSTVPPTR